MICKECGLEIEDGSEFCTSCGAPQGIKEEIPEQEAPAAPAAQEDVPEVPQTADISEIPEPEIQLSKKERRELEIESALDRKNRAGILSGRSIYWSLVLMSIPVLGWLIAVIWACGLCRKYQKKFIARAFLARLLTALVFIIVGIIVYRIFGYELKDLPELLESLFTWISTVFDKLFK